jgi:RNA polymerase sigma-70 factor, ECF subfamily
MEQPITWDDLYTLMNELRAMARRLLALEGNAQSLQPTALVDSALRRQRPEGVDWSQVTWVNRKYFFGAIYQAMRRALIDHARKRMARHVLRLVQVGEIPLEDPARAAHEHPEVIDVLCSALERLRSRNPEWAELIEHRYWSGYTFEESARVMAIGEKTARRWWKRARLLLYDEVRRILNEDAIKPSNSHEIADR